MKKLFIVLTILSFLTISVTSCREEKTPDEKIEAALDDVSKDLEHASDDVKDAAEDLQDEIEEVKEESSDDN